MIDAGSRKAILDFLRPLEAGLDGAEKFGLVDDRLRRVAAIAAEHPDVDGDLLFLVGVFFDRSKWLGSMGHESRTRIFLAGLGLSAELIQRFLRALKRAETHPESLEERIVWDAARLEDVGALGVVRGVLAGHRERLDFAELANELEQSQAEIIFFTPAGQRMASERREETRRFAAALRRESTAAPTAPP